MTLREKWIAMGLIKSEGNEPKPRKPRHTTTPEELKRLKSALRAGCTQAQAAQHAGVSVKVAQTWAHKLGTRSVRPEPKRDKIKRLHAEGFPPSAIAAQTGATLYYVKANIRPKK